MLLDAHGHALSGATPEAVPHLDKAVRAFALVFGDLLGHYDAAIKAAPNLVFAHLGKAWALSLANDPLTADRGKAIIEGAREFNMNERERVHFAALSKALEGQRTSAVAILERHLMSHPFDLVAHMAAMQMDGHLGRFGNARDRSARALPRWSERQPGFGLILSFYGFGLEESGEYARAEATARRAAELEPYNYWPHHCVSHVLEMTGRPTEGLVWMDSREPFWSGKEANNRAHIWWHKALFHVELGEYDKALALFDGPISGTMRPLAMSMCNLPALLWRLEALGCNPGRRWHKLSPVWDGHTDGKLCVFTDIHAAMIELRTGAGEAVERRVATMGETANGTGENAEIYGRIGLPVVEALTAFSDGRYAEAVEALLLVRPYLWRMGGSHAQRDVIEWTLAEAAGRAGRGMRDVAISLANERLGQRPDSKPNQHFLRQAQAIAA